MKKLLLLITAVCFANLSFSQNNTLKEVTPAAAGVSAERLTRIDKILQEYIDKKWIAGGAAIIAKDGKIFYYKAIGYNDIATRAPLKRDAIFRIASQTKAITSVAVMMLYEEGKFLLEDPVSKFIPEFKNPKLLDKFNEADSTYTTVPAKREITIRDLLTHTSVLIMHRSDQKKRMLFMPKPVWLEELALIKLYWEIK
jgi:CubicO group peptidase (beta-lactamase class C family)